MGSYCSILNNTDDVWSVKLGPDEAALDISKAILTAVANVIPFVALAATSISVTAAGVVQVSGDTQAAHAAQVARSLHDELTKQLGMDRLSPGEKQQYWRTLSLWQQGTGIRTRVNPDNDKEILYMSPIFSGATDHSENVHEIRFWLNKWGVENVKTVRI